MQNLLKVLRCADCTEVQQPQTTMSAFAKQDGEIYSPSDIKQVCIIGGGNAAQVMMSLLGEARDQGSGVRVAVFAPFGDEAERLRKGIEEVGGIVLENADGTSICGKPDIVSKNVEDCIPGSQIVFLPLPTFAHPSMCKTIAPHLDKGTWVGSLPGQGGFQWIAGKEFDMSPKGKAIKLFGFDKLPYNCRTIEYAKRVEVIGYKENLGVASIPSSPELTAGMAKTLSKVVPKLNLHTISSFLSITLAPANQCIHPARMYGLFHNVTKLDRCPLFYDEMDEFSANLIQSVSDEIHLIARGLESTAAELGKKLDLSDLMTVGGAMRAVYKVDDTSTLQSSFQTCHGFTGIKTPMKKVEGADGKVSYEVDWSVRYFTEDVPALCVLHALAELVGVPVPTIDKLIHWAQPNMPGGYPFLIDDKLNEDGKHVMYTPQYWGILNKEELFDFHEGLLG